MTDADFLRYLAKIGQTVKCETVMAKRTVTERLEAIAKWIESVLESKQTGG